MPRKILLPEPKAKSAPSVCDHCEFEIDEFGWKIYHDGEVYHLSCYNMLMGSSANTIATQSQ